MKHKDDDSGFKAKAEPRPRIPKGEYEAVCIKKDISIYLGSEKKLYLHFQIIEGNHQGVKLFAAYKYYKPFPTGSKYYTDWSIANSGLPRRRDKMSPRVFLNKLFLVRVKDAMPRYEDRTPKPDMFRYSVIDRIIEKVIG